MPAFRYPLRAKPFDDGDHQPDRCPVCGEAWTPRAGSRLQCHAACLFTPEALAHIASADKTETELADAYGVTRGVVRAAKKEGKRLDAEATEQLAGKLSHEQALLILSQLMQHPNAAVQMAVRKAVAV